MSMYDLPEEPEWVVKSRKAAYCARRRFKGADDLTPQDMEDLIQAATLAYWKHHRDGRPVPFCFVCARQAAEKYFYRNVLGRNPRSLFSLDVPLTDDGGLPHEWLGIPAPSKDESLRLNWLSDEVLEGALCEARRAAGYPNGRLTRFWDTIQKDKRIIRLAVNGHTNASIAQLVGTTEGAIRNRRQRIRRRPLDAASVEYDRSGRNHIRAREIQLAYPGHRKPATA